MEDTMTEQLLALGFQRESESLLSLDCKGGELRYSPFNDAVSVQGPIGHSVFFPGVESAADVATLIRLLGGKAD